MTHWKLKQVLARRHGMSEAFLAPHRQVSSWKPKKVVHCMKLKQVLADHAKHGRSGASLLSHKQVSNWKQKIVAHFVAT